MNRQKQKRTLRDFVDGKADSPFEYFILAVILVNTVSLGVETIDTLTQMQQRVCMIIDEICLGIFIIELALKAIAYNKDFFKYKWNIFDLVIVLVSLASSLPYFSIFRTLRIFRSVKFVKMFKSIRALRTMKLVCGLDHLQRILRAIVFAVPGILWVFIMLLIFYYMYAVFGTFCFAADFPEFFGSLPKSFLTLFQVMTFDSWCSGIARPVIKMHSWAYLYFFSFVVISAFTILNVIVGIIVDSIEMQHEKTDEQRTCETEAAFPTNIPNATIEQLLNQIDTLRAQVEQLKKQKTAANDRK